MIHFKSNLQFRLVLLSLCSFVLIALSLVTDPSQKPLERAKDVFVCLAQISVLAESLIRKPDIPGQGSH
jgi:hypothetical protein